MCRNKKIYFVGKFGKIRQIFIKCKLAVLFARFWLVHRALANFSSLNSLTFLGAITQGIIPIGDLHG